MLCEISKEVLGLFEKAVLILVLMEDALRGMAVFTVILSMGVLILVLMEDALRARREVPSMSEWSQS